MVVMVASDAHFVKTPDGIIYSKSADTYNFWKQYLEVFDKVIVIARVKDIDKKEDTWLEASGKNVEFCCLPDYLGPFEYIKKRKEIKKIIENAVLYSDRYILRLPSQIGSIAYNIIRSKNLKYGAEVGGDPWEALRRGNVKSIVRPIARVVFRIRLYNQCKNSIATSYVTKYALQKRYPCKNKTTNYSDVQLKLEQIKSDRIYVEDKKCIEIVNVGSMTTLYKAQDVQIKAIKICRDKGYDVRLKLIGDGIYKDEFKKLAKSIGIENYVDFKGSISGNDNVMKEIDKSDIFILPSLVEGLPRALIEGMARGLPCIGTNVGGIPELLKEEFIVEKDNVEDLSNKLIYLIEKKEMWKQIGDHNILVAKEYIKENIDYKRNEFYRYIYNI